MSGVLRPIAPLAYTGDRATVYQQFRQAYDDKAITAKTLRDQVIRLNEIQRKYNARLEKARERRAFEKQQREAFEREVRRAEEAERKRVEEALSAERVRRAVEAVRMEREAREAKRKAQAKARNEEKKRLTREVKAFAGTVIYDETLNFNQFSKAESRELYQAGRQLEGHDSFYLRIIRYGADTSIWSDEIIELGNLKNEPTQIYYKGISYYIENYESSVFNKKEGEENILIRARIIISTATTIPSKRIQQAFRDGEKHCVLDPLISLFTTYYENANNKASQKTYRCIVNALKAFLVEYENGVPEEYMERIAKACHRAIVMYDVLGNEVTVWNRSSSKKFHFTNTRENHLDVGHITLDKQYIRVTVDELKEILLKHDTEGIFYLYKTHNGQPQSIRSKDGAWAVFNEDYDIYNEFNDKTGIKHCKFNAVKYPTVNDFLKEGTIVHSAPVALCEDPNNLEGVSSADMSKAYTQHAVAPYYNGFMGAIQQWALLTGKGLEFVRSHLGMFRVRIVSVPTMLEKLGIREGLEYTLTQAELLYMCDVFGLIVELIAGVWGSRMDIEYTPEMMENGRYARWAGKLGMEKKNDFYMFKGSSEWASHLKSELGDDRVSYYDGFIRVKNPKPRMNTTHHLFAQITAYCRINLLEMMRRVDGEIVKVVLDEVYYRGTMKTDGLNVVYKVNKGMKEHNFTDAWYHTSTVDIASWSEYEDTFDGNRVLAGAGGTGKTYSVFHNTSINQPLYVVPSHSLGKDFSKQYGCQYTTIHKFIGLEIDGKKCRAYKDDFRMPEVAFIDENTMIAEEHILKALEMYPTTRFFIAGDMDGKQWYQCRNGKPGQFSKIWMPSREEWTYVDYTKDMRSRDDKLKEFKETIRSLMRGVFTDGNERDAMRINYFVRTNYKTVKFEEACKMFNSGDVWIAGTHQTNAKLLEAGVVSGVITPKKEAILSADAEGQKRGSFTIHSFQGRTIEDKRVFVSLDTFEYAMFYTAISRVRSFNQLVIVA